MMKSTFLVILIGVLAAGASAFLRAGPAGRTLQAKASTTEQAVFRRLMRWRRSRKTHRESFVQKEGDASQLMQGVVSYGMSFKVDDWKHCIETGECEVPEELFGNPELGAGSHGQKFESLEELRTILEEEDMSTHADPAKDADREGS